ncbi:hypothetical protein FI667_g16834, partial [Globisporangium splendens]
MRVNTGLRVGQRERRQERHGGVTLEVKPLLFWTPDEIANLLQAWRETIENPPKVKRSATRGFNACVYARFKELCGGSTPRSFQAANVKKQFLNHSYLFILDYNKNVDLELAAQQDGDSNDNAASKANKSTKKDARKASVASNGDDGEAGVNHWFALTPEERKEESWRANMNEQRRFALLSMDEAAFEGMGQLSKLQGNLSMQVPWSSDEVRLMYRAWRKAIDTPAAGNRNPLFSLNARLYEHMMEFSNGEMKRTKQSVTLKKEAMKLSYEFIRNFNETQKNVNEESGAEKLKKPRKTNWFNLTSSEQESIVRTKYGKASFMYFDEALFREMDVLMKATGLLQEVVGTRQGLIWSEQETKALIQAWSDILGRQEHRKQRQDSSQLASSICKRFLSLHLGVVRRSERSILQKLKSLKYMFTFVSEYNRMAKIKSRKIWFSFNRPEKKKLFNDAMREVASLKERTTKSYCDLDKNTHADLEVILKKSAELGFFIEPLSDEDSEDDESKVDDESDHEIEIGDGRNVDTTLLSTGFNELLKSHALQQECEEPEDFALTLAMLHNGHIPSDIPLSTIRINSPYNNNPIILDPSAEEAYSEQSEERSSSARAAGEKRSNERGVAATSSERRLRETFLPRSSTNGYSSSSSDSEIDFLEEKASTGRRGRPSTKTRIDFSEVPAPRTLRQERDHAATFHESSIDSDNSSTTEVAHASRPVRASAKKRSDVSEVSLRSVPRQEQDDVGSGNESSSESDANPTTEVTRSSRPIRSNAKKRSDALEVLPRSTLRQERKAFTSDHDSSSESEAIAPAEPTRTNHPARTVGKKRSDASEVPLRRTLRQGRASITTLRESSSESEDNSSTEASRTSRPVCTVTRKRTDIREIPRRRNSRRGSQRVAKSCSKTSDDDSESSSSTSDGESRRPSKKSRSNQPEEAVSANQRPASADFSAIAELLAKQSEHMFLVMREIRDEIKLDREERERHREEMRIYREERRKHEEEAASRKSGTLIVEKAVKGKKRPSLK